jgi:hypothetical protein
MGPLMELTHSAMGSLMELTHSAMGLRERRPRAPLTSVGYALRLSFATRPTRSAHCAAPFRARRSATTCSRRPSGVPLEPFPLNLNPKPDVLTPRALTKT